MLVALVNIALCASPPTGFTTAVERVALERTGPTAELTIDPFSKSLLVSGVSLRKARLDSHLCPTATRTREGLRFACSTRRLWASLDTEGGELFLEIRSLRGVTWRWEPDGIEFTGWPLKTVGIPETCPGTSDAAIAECALVEGRYFEAEERYAAALIGPDSHLARLRLGDFALRRGDPEAALSWYTKVTAAGPVTRIAQLRACDLTGGCLTGKPPTSEGLAGAPAIEAEVHLIRMALAMDRTGEALRRLFDAIEGGSPICTSNHAFCQRVVQVGLQASDERTQELGLSIFASGHLGDGALGLETTIAAAEAAQQLGAPLYAANVLASISSHLAKPELGAHLLRVAHLYLAGKDPVRARFVVEYAEQRLDAATFSSRDWRTLRQRLAPAPARRTDRAQPPPLAERLPALTDAVNVSAELARAAKASSAAVTSGEPQ